MGASLLAVAKSIYYRKGTDIGADGEPIEILLGPTVTKLERCRRTR